MQNICEVKFSALSDLNHRKLNNIKFVYIFGETGNEVIFVTEDDKAWSFGSNTNGLLGLGHKNLTQEPSLINELCNKEVVDIRSGKDFVLALTKCGHLYSWGNNSKGELGNGSQAANYSPMINKTLFESDINVIDMSCGYFHSLILTNMGEVYGFGGSIKGESSQLIPVKISQLLFNSEKVTSISCGALHSLALTESGQVFSWGYNDFGQIGIGNNIKRNFPVIIKSIDNIVFNKISCGSAHSLLLSSDGYIYTFGNNSNGELGNGNTENQSSPLKLNESVKFSDIATDFYCQISIATAMNGNCYVWGECVNEVVMTPKETEFKSIHDIFAEYGKRKITYKPFIVKNEIKENRILKKIAELFNNPEISDLKLKIDNNYIYTQKLFLKMFCNSFTSFLPENWLKSDTNEIELTQYSYDVYYSFLKYIYTDCVDIESNKSIALLDLAHHLDEEELKLKCIAILKKSICDENICVLYSAAVKYGSQELEDFCFEFSSYKLNQICKSDAFKRMDENSRVRFIARVAEKNLFK